MTSREKQRFHLRHATHDLKMALKHLKRSNSADQLSVGEVSNYWNFEEMINHLIHGVRIIHDSFDEE